MKQKKEQKFYQILSCYLCRDYTVQTEDLFLAFLLTNCLCMSRRVEADRVTNPQLIKVADDNVIEKKT